MPTETLESSAVTFATKTHGLASLLSSLPPDLAAHARSHAEQHFASLAASHGQERALNILSAGLESVPLPDDVTKAAPLIGAAELYVRLSGADSKSLAPVTLWLASDDADAAALAAHFADKPLGRVYCGLERKAQAMASVVVRGQAGAVVVPTGALQKCLEGPNAGKPGPCPGQHDQPDAASSRKPARKPQTGKPAAKPKPKPKPAKPGSESSKLTAESARQILAQIPKTEPSDEEKKQYDERRRKTEELLRRSQELLEATKPRIDNEEPRPLGDRGQQTYDRLRSALYASPGLSDQQMKEYGEGLRKVAGRITETAHERIAKHLGETKFFPDSPALTEQVWQDMIAETKNPKLGWFTRFSLWLFTTKADKELVGLQTELLHKQFLLNNNSAGVYARDTKSLYLDGGASSASGMGRKMDTQTAPMVHAHELGHAIDGPNHEYSDSKEWLDAYAAEINRDDEPLTEYARVKPSEGFAEFCRLLYGGGVDLTQVEKTFPLCAAFAKEKQLWPA